MTYNPLSYKLPYLDDCKGDLSKPWFVCYYYLNSDTKKFQRFRFYQGFQTLNTIEERIIFAQKLIKAITDHLLTGFNPFQNPGYDFLRYITHPGIYAQFQLNEIKISERLIQVVETRKKLNRKKTTQTKISRVKNFILYLEERGLKEISLSRISKEIAKGFINDLLNEKEKSPTYINAHLSTLKTIFDDLIDNDEINYNPFGKIKMLSQNPKGYKYFENHHIEILKPAIIALDPQLWLFVNFIVYCFIRPKELRFLKVGDLLIDTRQVTIRGELSKNKKTQTVLVPDFIFELIEKHNIKSFPPSFYIFGKEGKPGPIHYSNNYFTYKHNNLIRNLGFGEEYSLYSWKHTGMIKTKVAGGDLKDIQSQARHSSLDQTNTYFKSRGFFDGEKMRDLFDL